MKNFIKFVLVSVTFFIKHYIKKLMYLAAYKKLKQLMMDLIRNTLLENKESICEKLMPR